ncbi:hypothetical protein SMICM17S_10210 [Streptomyces microflavus]
MFRGWLTQAVGAFFFRSPWFAVIPQAVLFAAAHGWGHRGRTSSACWSSVWSAVG